MATIRQNSKLLVNEYLKKAGLIVWRTFSPNYKLHGLIVIACNRLNPSDPWRAYRYIHGELSRYAKSSTIRPERQQRKHQERVNELRRELAGSTAGDVCPCCGQDWDSSHLIPDDITE